MPIDPISQANPGFPPLSRGGWPGRPATTPSPAIEPPTRLAAWHMTQDSVRLSSVGDRALGGNVPGYGAPPAGDPFDFTALDGNGDGYLSGTEISADLDRFAYSAADGRRIITGATLDAALAKGAVPQPTPPVVPAPAPAPGYGPVPAPFAPAPPPYYPQPVPAPQPMPVPQPVPAPSPVPVAPPQPFQPPQPAPTPPRKKDCCPGH